MGHDVLNDAHQRRRSPEEQLLDTKPTSRDVELLTRAESERSSQPTRRASRTAQTTRNDGETHRNELTTRFSLHSSLSLCARNYFAIPSHHNSTFYLDNITLFSQLQRKHKEIMSSDNFDAMPLSGND
uniref:Uncharacterized protein n=1 Tax=Ascaris lumbricoides TaxID=6252 RepID=A0A9J2PFG5_ASCLU